MRQFTGNEIFHIGLTIIVFTIVITIVFLVLNQSRRSRLRRRLELEYGERDRRVKHHSKE